MSDLNDSASTGDGVSFSSAFLELCAKVRKNDSSILPEPGKPFRISCHLSEKEDMELADALLENTNVTYLQLRTEKSTTSSAEAMSKYIRTSKHLQHICWHGYFMTDDQELEQGEEMWRCFLPAFEESTSLKELQINFSSHWGAVQPGARKYVDAYPKFMVSDSNQSRWTTRRLVCGCSLVWIEKEHHSTRAHTRSFAGQDHLPYFDQSALPSCPSKTMFAWAYD
jgi:hypothetical protein